MASPLTYKNDWSYTIPGSLNIPKTADHGFYITLKNLKRRMKQSVERLSLKVLMDTVG
jgi:hypothetical protein